ncbi:MAG: hypothetical protein KJ749_09620 [Planctomycetes bacterium]|nr:hypothetical protein [Planctomycetota bacterium]
MRYFSVYVFPVLVAAGLWLRELSLKVALASITLWVIANFGLPSIGVPGYVVLLVNVVINITLILMIFRSDIKLR